MVAIAAVIIGAIIGSWLATVAIRMPQGRSANHGRSCCDSCNSSIAAWHMIPVVSYIYLRGKCRVCDGKINPLHFQIEAVSAIVTGAAFAIWEPVAAAVITLFALQLLVLAVLDLRHFWLPDRLNLWLAVTGLIVAGYMPHPVDVYDRMIGGTAGFLVLFGIAMAYKMLRGHAGLGAGDPKMLGAIGCWLGWVALPYVVLGAAIIGLVMAIVMQLMGRRISPETKLPFGSLMALSAYITCMTGWPG